MINNINSYADGFTSNSNLSPSNTKVDKIVEDYKKSSADKLTNNNSDKNSNLFLSSKAQKINAISNEFFSNSGPSFTDIEQLKERAYQLGLISKEEYAQLTKTELSQEKITSANDLSTQGIGNYIGDFLIRLEEGSTGNKDDENTNTESTTIEALKAVLTKAKEIITDVDKAKSEPKFNESLSNSLSFLKETITAAEFKSLPIDDQVGLTKVYQTLEIVDKLSPKRLTNEKINQYIKHSFS